MGFISNLKEQYMTSCRLQTVSIRKYTAGILTSEIRNSNLLAYPYIIYILNVKHATNW